MRRFRFRLEKVLSLRKNHEQEAKIQLGRAIGILTKIESNIKLNAAKHSQAASQRFSGIGAADGGQAGGQADAHTGASSMLAWDSYILRLEQEAQRLAEEAAQAEAVVEERRSEYLEASRDMKVMEKLKEKQEKEHRKEMIAAETKERDDKGKADTTYT